MISMPCSIAIIHIRIQLHETEIPKIIDPRATINYPSAMGSIIVGISESSASVRLDACMDDC